MSLEQLIKDQYDEFKATGVLIYRGQGTPISILDNNVIPAQLHRMCTDFTAGSPASDSFLKFHRPVNVLILGEGVGNLSKLLDIHSVLYNKPLRITAVEKYRAVNEFRVKYKYNNELQLIYRDAIDFINDNTESFDYVFVDVFELLDIVDMALVDLLFTKMIKFTEKIIINILNSEQKYEILKKYNNFSIDSEFEIVDNLVAFKNHDNSIFHIYNRPVTSDDKPLIKNKTGDILFKVCDDRLLKITLPSFMSFS